MIVGWLAALLVGAIIIASFTGLVLRADDIPLAAQLANPYIGSIIRFTLWQSALSALISVAGAILFARALYHRRNFPGRGILVRLTSVSLIVPTMVAILGVIAVHGRTGWVNDLLSLVGVSRQDYLYGLTGILIAHVFFNLPLVTRMLLNGLNGIPDYQWKLARQFGFNPWQAFRLVEWPAIRSLLPGAAGIVFMLCFTSFAIVLSLGGGPRSTTLEVAIYQALRFDFDLARAVALSLIQIGICLLLAILFFSTRATPSVQADQGAGRAPHTSRSRVAAAVDGAVILVAALFLLSPFAAVIANSLGSDGWRIVTSDRFHQAGITTLIIALSAGLVSTLFGLAIANLVARLRLFSQRRWLGALPEIIGMLTLLMPPITLGTGLFLLLRTATDVLSLGYYLVIGINAIFTLAFTLRILVAPMQQQLQRFSPLTRSLGMNATQRWRWAFWPVIKRPVCYALAVASTLSAGDMGVIALFGTDQLSTLPLLIYRLLGSYQLAQAGVVAICLCALCFLLFVLLERIAGRPDPAIRLI